MQISITLCNPLKISLLLKEVELLWRFAPSDDTQIPSNEVLDNEPSLAAGQTLESSVIRVEKIMSVLLEGECNKPLNFTITPLRIGQLTIHGVAFKYVPLLNEHRL